MPLDIRASCTTCPDGPRAWSEVRFTIMPGMRGRPGPNGAGSPTPMLRAALAADRVGRRLEPVIA
jgi:hypothetical protein